MPPNESITYITHNFKINLFKSLAIISCDCWNNLLDIVEIRNTIVHNNGMIDKKFRNTQTYTKIASMIEGNLIFLTPQIIQSYFNYVLELITSVTKYYNSLYENTLHSLIANFYFNSHPLNSDNCTWHHWKI